MKKPLGPAGESRPAAGITLVFNSSGRSRLLAGGLLWIVAFAHSVNAQEPRFDSIRDRGAVFSQLADYVRQIGGEAVQLARTEEPQGRGIVDQDDAYSALLA